MSPVPRSLALVAVAVLGGCYQQSSGYYSTYPEPVSYAGPPGGGMDSSWQYQQYPGYPDGYPNGYPAGTEDTAAMQTDASYAASSDPMAPGYAMGATTDAEIAATLDPYGEWVWIESYGYVWRPSTTAVGLDFTPYESCGSWVWTDDWGWTFACEWDWGWLPFHYGRWGWFEDYWAWQPGYEWSPGWVDWRSGGDYCGWRAQAPVSGYWDNGSWVGGGSGTIVGGGNAGWNVRDHRGPGSPTWTPTAANTKIPALHESAWRFLKQDDFGKRIRPNLVKTPLETLRVTKETTRPPMRGSVRAVPTASIMQSRLHLQQQRARQASQRSGPIDPRTPSGRLGGLPPRSPVRDRPAYGDTLSPTRDRTTPVERMWPRGPARSSGPTYGSSGGRGAPSVRNDGRFDPPSRPLPQPRGSDRFTPGRDRSSPPSRSVPDGPRGGERFTPPSRPSGGDRFTPPSRPSSPPPARDYSPPSRGSSSPTYSPPSRSDSSRGDSGSRGSSSSGGNWSPPSRGSSSPSSSSGGSFGGGSRGGGFSGGGGRRGR